MNGSMMGCGMDGWLRRLVVHKGSVLIEALLNQLNDFRMQQLQWIQLQRQLCSKED